MDEFTEQHLTAWIETHVYDEDREPFESYATRALRDDPTLVNYSWPSLFDSFRRSVGHR